ncbi:hypothetical protein, partial [Priestia megaterium]|uniref:hypothetical protein n=1 Tax=Priestia megaterium TaxID=1404 RepID=UPI002A6A9773
TKQPVTSTIPANGCLKGALIPVSQTGCSPQRTEWMEKGRIKEPFEDVTDKIVKEYQSKYAGS